jgi:maltoporin
MNKLIKIVSVLAVLTGFSMTPLMADSSDFAGAYIGIQAQAVGVELDGKHTSAGDDTGEVTTGVAGRVAAIAGAEVGYAFPVSDTVLIDIGANYYSGDAQIKTSNTDTTATADVTFKMKDLMTAYIAPTFAISDTASIYLKVGYMEAETSTTGDVTQPSDLEGTLIGIGSRSLLGNGMFMRTEAGMIDFDNISVTGKGAGGTGKTIGTTSTVSADPLVAYGSISIGFKF